MRPARARRRAVPGQALPDDDYTFWQARPYLVRTLERFAGRVEPEGDFPADVLRCLRLHVGHGSGRQSRGCAAGVAVAPIPPVTVWAELYAEHNVSDATEAEYSGFGGAMGCEFRPAARLDLGAWAGIGTRPYAQKVDGENRRDTPLPVGAWATYRLRPWLEMFSSVDWESFASTIDGNEYSWWRVGGGVKFVFESKAGGR